MSSPLPSYEELRGSFRWQLPAVVNIGVEVADRQPPAAQAILVTDSAALADEVAAAVERQLKTLARGETAAASWRDHGAVITVPSLRRIAPPELDACSYVIPTAPVRIGHDTP